MGYVVESEDSEGCIDISALENLHEAVQIFLVWVRDDIAQEEELRDERADFMQKLVKGWWETTLPQ
jgi:hypothetical protein